MREAEFGFIQGRMSKTPSKKILQYFPKKNWQKEFNYAKKNNFKFIEYFAERKFNKNNPIWSLKGLNKIKGLVKKNNLYNYSFCDDYFITHNFCNFKDYKFYAEKIIKVLSFLKIKVYVLALFEKSEINKKNIQRFIPNLQFLSEKLKKKKIKLALETNLDNFYIKKLIKLIKSKNLFLVYDTGNRLKKNNTQYDEILNLKKYICHIHLKDKNFKGKNVVLGQGKVNFARIFKALKKIKYNGKFTFETNRGNEPIETMKNNRDIILNLINSL